MSKVPCDDCGKPISVGRLGKKGNDKFVCNACFPKYRGLMALAKHLDRLN